MVAAAEYVKFCALNYEIDPTNPICLRQNSPVSFFDTGEKTLTRQFAPRLLRWARRVLTSSVFLTLASLPLLGG